MSLALWAFTVVLTIAAYWAGGTSAVAAAVVARVLPGALAGPFTARLAGRRSRRAVLPALTGGATAVLAGLTVLAALDAPLALVLVLAAAFSIAASGQPSALAGLLPGLTRDPRQLAVANRLRQQLGHGAYCLGALAGGAAAAGLSVAAGFAVATAASAVALAALLRLEPNPRPAPRTDPAGTGITAELLLGLQDVRTTPELRECAGGLAAIGLVYGALDVLLVVVAVQLVGLGTGGVGILTAAWGAGGLIGAIAALRLLTRGRFSSGLDAAAALVAVALAAAAIAADPVVAVLGFGVLGIGGAVAETAGRTLIQRLTSDESLARVCAVAEAGSQAAVASGALLAALCLALLGIRAALLATALVLPVVVIARWRAVQRLDAQSFAPERELATLRALELLAPLPLATVETLAIHAVPRVVFADEQILLPGDAGSCFYVIADGTFEVHVGAVVRRLGPGDYFGEIALLRDVPRTTAVVATSDGLLYVLGREQFLRTVTGHVGPAQAAGAVADARRDASPVPAD
jgi:cyclic nucleotide-binding protein/MFS transporter